jgi:hypothetical protein
MGGLEEQEEGQVNGHLQMVAKPLLILPYDTIECVH